MKKAGDIIILDDTLRTYAGEKSWHGIAWIHSSEDENGVYAEDERERNEKRRHDFIRSLPTRYREYTFATLEEHEGNKGAIAAARNLQPGENLFIHGSAGNGKTHLAIATGREQASTKAVAFWGIAKLFSVLRSSAVGEAEKPNLHRPDILILDDLGKVKATDFVYQEFYGMLEERWADARTTIFTANHRPSECATQVASDGQAAAAILSRLASGTVVEVRGRDQRLAR